MGKLTRFDITIDSPSSVFYAGQVVHGHVTVELNEPKKVRGLRLAFFGKARAHWTERVQRGSGNNRHYETKHYKADEDYFNQEVLLFGQWPKLGSDSIMVPAGRNTYPFQFQLPPNLPSSFEGQYGSVRYWLKSTIDQPWKFDHTTKTAFTVISLLDLNREPTATMPLQGHDEKTLCCWCCKSGPISAVFRVDRSGFVPGEAIPLNVEISNNSNRKMNGSSVDFRMVTQYHARGKTKSQTRSLAKIKHGGFDEGQHDVWSGEVLVIPPLPPSFLTGCRIIDIHYFLELKVDPAGPAFDLKIPFEIIVGTIPLQHIVQQYPPIAPSQPVMYPPMPTYSGAAPQPSVTGHPQPPIAGDPPPSGPPPSYAECVFGKVNIKEEEDNEFTKGNMDFAPQYTYYNWGHTPSAPYPPEEDKD